MSETLSERQILGVNFYVGDVQGAIRRVAGGGLLVVPAAPALKDVAWNENYREALMNADVAIADSAFMVLVWNFLQGDSIQRISGLKYLKELLQLHEVRMPGNTFWVMAGRASSRKNVSWLRSEGIEVPLEFVYQAPMYGSTIEDKELIDKLQLLRPKHVVITVGGGTQERLGLYLKRNLDYLPAIHCIGAAIAFLSGDQVRIPGWADRLYLGWLFRCLSSPRRYVPRYLSAPQLVPLLWRYRDQLPVPEDSEQPLTQAEYAREVVLRADETGEIDEMTRKNEGARIAVVGSGYVGLVASACFAEIGHRVVCVDNDESKVRMLQEGGIPIHEEHLPELLDRHRGKSLEFTSDLREATQSAQAIFVAVGTPQSETGSADLSYVDAVASEIARSIESYKVIVEKSTVPVYTNEWIRRVVERNGVPKELFDVTSNPEFLREGTAVVDFLHADRIVIGAATDAAANLLKMIYLPLTSGEYYSVPGSVPGPRTATDPPPILHTSTKAAEIIKHASNALLATKISFINAVANVCEAAGADVEEVARGIGMDSRIGPKFLRAGVGYGGSCFPKDVAAFRHVAEQVGVDFGLLHEVEKINEEQKQRFFQKIRSALWTFRGKKIGVLGLAFKGGTDDVRESPALDIVKKLLSEGCVVCAHDPAAANRCKEIIPAGPKMRYVDDPYAAAQDADALLILNDWQEFAELDLAKLHYTLRYPIVIDGRNLYDPATMTKAGFTYLSVGRPGLAQPVDPVAAFFLPRRRDGAKV